MPIAIMLILETFQYVGNILVNRVFVLWSETGGLFGLAVRMMQLFSQNKRLAAVCMVIVFN